MNERYNRAHVAPVCFVLILVSLCILLLTGCLTGGSDPASSPVPSASTPLASTPPASAGEANFGEVRDLAVTPEGAVWVATGEGLMRLHGEGWECVLEDTEVNALAVAPDGSLWLGVGCQVQRLDGAAWETVFACGEHLPWGIVLDIAFTPDGAASIANGFGQASFDGVWWGEERSWTMYSRADGLALDEVLTMAVAPDGTLWVGTTSGAARFDGAWTAYATGDAVRAIAFAPEGQVWLDTTVVHPAGVE